jgi:hypothetical protein
MNTTRLGKLTIAGGTAVEEHIAGLIGTAAKRILRFVPMSRIKALVLGGGYGRGEGGIRLVHGRQMPGSPLTFYLFTEGLAASHRLSLEREIDGGLERLRQAYPVPIEFSTVDASRMSRYRAKVRWHELCDRHKVLAGHPLFLSRLASRFRAERLDPHDVADTLVSSGGLILVNDVITARGQIDERRDEVVRNFSRAVIGYGSALLFFTGAYDPGYVERRRRMAAHALVPEAARATFDDAMSYRATGDPRAEERLFEQVRTGRGRAILAQIHLELERLRLGRPTLSWTGYVHVSLAHEVDRLGRSLRRMAQGAVRYLTSPHRLGPEAPGQARWGLRVAGDLGAARALFPIVAYGVGSKADCDIARWLLGAMNLNARATKLNWLRLWTRAYERRGGIAGAATSQEAQRGAQSTQAVRHLHAA